MSFNKLLATLLKWIPLLNRWLFSFSKRYIDVYRNYSYDFSANGEAALVRRLKSLLPAQAVVFDVGANQGTWAEAVKKQFPAAEVHCFELSSRTFRNLQQKFSGTPGVKLNNIGLSDKEGEVSFRDYGENHGGNTLIQDPSYIHRGQLEMVSSRVVTGDAYCNQNGVQAIDLLKIDVEGWEYFVLKGFDALLRAQKIGVVQFEYGYTHADVHTLMRDFYQLFETHGMRVGRLTPKGVDFAPFSYELNDFKSGPNFIACQSRYVEQLSRF